MNQYVGPRSTHRNLAERISSALPWHANVEQQHIDGNGPHQVKSFVRSPGLTYDLEITLCRDQLAQARANQLMVIHKPTLIVSATAMAVGDLRVLLLVGRGRCHPGFGFEPIFELVTRPGTSLFIQCIGGLADKFFSIDIR